jgi:glycosyltransferase involved in cell wall biosynthesis
MAEVLVELGTDKAAREALGARAAQEARTRHSLKGFVNSYERLYDELRGLVTGNLRAGLAY